MGTYLVIGVVSGVIYGLVALGIVLIYKGSRIFNFAQAEFGTVAMYVMFLGLEHDFFLGRRIPYLFVTLAALLVGFLLGIVTERVVVRPLESVSKVIALVGTAGIALLAIGIELWRAKPEPRAVVPPLAGDGLTILGYVVSPQKLIAFGVLLAVAIGAALFFQRTALGTAILANSQDQIGSRVVGVNVNRISRTTWGMAGLLGALAGVLLAPEVSFYPGFMTTIILIPAFTAAILGGMTSLPGAFVGGQIVGLIEAMAQYLISLNPGLREIPEGPTILVFVVLLLALLLRPRGLLGSEA